MRMEARMRVFGYSVTRPMEIKQRYGLTNVLYMVIA